MTLCETVRQKAVEYWKTSPDIRPAVFHWLDEHALKCDACALLLEEIAQKGPDMDAIEKEA